MTSQRALLAGVAAKMLGYRSVEALMERRTMDLYANPDDRAPILEETLLSQIRGQVEAVVESPTRR